MTTVIVCPLGFLENVKNFIELVNSIIQPRKKTRRYHSFYNEFFSRRLKEAYESQRIVSMESRAIVFREIVDEYQTVMSRGYSNTQPTKDDIVIKSKKKENIDKTRDVFRITNERRLIFFDHNDKDERYITEKSATICEDITSLLSKAHELIGRNVPKRGCTTPQQRNRFRIRQASHLTATRPDKNKITT